MYITNSTFQLWKKNKSIYVFRPRKIKLWNFDKCFKTRSQTFENFCDSLLDGFKAVYITDKIYDNLKQAPNKITISERFVDFSDTCERQVKK